MLVIKYLQSLKQSFDILRNIYFIQSNDGNTARM